MRGRRKDSGSRCDAFFHPKSVPGRQCEVRARVAHLDERVCVCVSRVYVKRVLYSDDDPITCTRHTRTYAQRDGVDVCD